MNVSQQPPSRRELVAAITLGLTGAIAFGVAPLLLNHLNEMNRLSDELIGISVFGELIGLAVGTLVAPPLLGRGNSRAGLTAVLITMSAANVGCAFSSDWLIVVARTIAGVGGGTLIWSTVSVILKTDFTERLAGIFLTSQTIAQFILAAVVTTYLATRFGPNAGYWTLATLTGISLLLVPLIPTLAAVSHEQSDRIRLRNCDWFSLLSVGLFMATLNSIIVYAEGGLKEAGVPSDSAPMVFTLVLAAQIVGGSMGALMCNRLKPAHIILSVSAMIGAVLVGLSAVTSFSILFAIYAVFGFCWLFVGPFHVGWLIHIDQSRRAAELNPAATLLGLAFGPLIAALVLQDNGTPPFWVYWGFLGSSLICFALAQSNHIERTSQG